jgi:hypothetical protein
METWNIANLANLLLMFRLLKDALFCIQLAPVSQLISASQWKDP